MRIVHFDEDLWSSLLLLVIVVDQQRSFREAWNAAAHYLDTYRNWS